MYCCLTTLLKPALADVAIFISYYNTPEEEMGEV